MAKHPPDDSARRLNDAVSAIYDAALDRTLWPTALERIAHAVHADSGFTTSLDVMPEQGGIVGATGVDSQLFLTGLTKAMQHNPLIEAWEAKGAHSGALYHASDLATPEQIEDWKMNAEWARPLRFHWTIATIVYERQPFVTPKNAICVFRAKESPVFTPAEKDVMRLLMPHLQRGLLIHWRLRQYERKLAAAQEVLDRLMLGVILLDRQGRVVLMNRVAENLVRQDRPLTVRQNELRARLPEEHEALRGLVAHAAQTGAGAGLHAGGTVHLHDEGGRALLALATPLSTDRADARWLGPGVCAALFLSEPGAQHPLSMDLLEQWFGFTPAEAQVAVDLMNGLDPKEICVRRSVSEETVRSQTKAIYEKTGVNRRAQLMRLLLTSPAALVQRQVELR